MAMDVYNASFKSTPSRQFELLLPSGSGWPNRTETTKASPRAVYLAWTSPGLSVKQGCIAKWIPIESCLLFKVCWFQMHTSVCSWSDIFDTVCNCMYGNFAVRLKGSQCIPWHPWPRAPLSSVLAHRLPYRGSELSPRAPRILSQAAEMDDVSQIYYVTVCQHGSSIAANWHEALSGELNYLFFWICRSFPFLCHFMSCFRHLTFLFRPHHPTIWGCVLARLQCLLRKPWQPREHSQKWRESHGTVGMRSPAPFGLACLIMQAQTGLKRGGACSSPIEELLGVQRHMNKALSGSVWLLIRARQPLTHIFMAKPHPWAVGSSAVPMQRKAGCTSGS